jgi:hypothetical protein
MGMRETLFRHVLGNIGPVHRRFGMNDKKQHPITEQCANHPTVEYEDARQALVLSRNLLSS